MPLCGAYFLCSFRYNKWVRGDDAGIYIIHTWIVLFIFRGRGALRLIKLEAIPTVKLSRTSN